MSPENFRIPSKRGDVDLNCYRWMPSTEPIASLQIVHGMTEYILRYSEFAEHLTSQGIAVYGHDHLGHGGTSEEKGYFADKDGYQLLVDDMACVTSRVEEELPGIPHLVMGHSMGSFVTRIYLTQYGDRTSGAIIMGTGNPSGATMALALMISKLICSIKGTHGTSKMLNNLVFGGYDKKFTEPDLPNKWLCTNPETLNAYEADPLCGFDFTNSGYRDLFTMIRRNGKEVDFERIPKDLPILLISGKEDPVGDFGKGVEKAKAGLENHGLKPEMILYPDMRHEILNEFDKDRVYDDISDWIVKVITP